MNAQIATHISALISRLIYQENQHSERGHHPARTREIDGLRWILEKLSEEYPSEVETAEVMAEEREQRRREANR